MDRFGNQPVMLILASTSPRRRELLGLAGWMFRLASANVDETPLPGETPRDYVLRLAEAKARAVSSEAHPGELILAADTTVADGQQILGKPESAHHAMQMLASLRGRVHQVFSAIAVYSPETGQIEMAVSETDVPMRSYTDEEINAYIATGDPFDKAGSYAIQHSEFQPVVQLTGCYANVVGLPLCHVERTLKKFNVDPKHDLPRACQRALHYTCTVYPEVQKGVL